MTSFRSLLTYVVVFCSLDTPYPFSFSPQSLPTLFKAVTPHDTRHFAGRRYHTSHRQVTDSRYIYVYPILSPRSGIGNNTRYDTFSYCPVIVIQNRHFVRPLAPRATYITTIRRSSQRQRSGALLPQVANTRRVGGARSQVVPSIKEYDSVARCCLQILENEYDSR